MRISELPQPQIGSQSHDGGVRWTIIYLCDTYDLDDHDYHYGIIIIIIIVTIVIIITNAS